MVNPLSLLREELKQTTQVALAKKIGISQQYLCDILQKRRGVAQAVLEYFGIEERVSYHKRNGKFKPDKGCAA